MNIAHVRLLLAPVLLAAALVSPVDTPRASRAQTVPTGTSVICPGSGFLEGVDVSQYQGAIDWVQVAQAGTAFAYARVADGTTVIDTQFDANLAGIRGAGMRAGAYLFFRPDQDPTAQANVLLSHYVPRSGDLIPAIDVELSGGVISETIAANLQTLVDTLRASLYVTPVIVTSPFFWNTYVGSSTFASAPLWTTQFNVTCPTVPDAWGNWSLWMYSGSGSVPGISFPVDLDRSNGAELPLYLPNQAFMPAAMASASSGR